MKLDKNLRRSPLKIRLRPWLSHPLRTACFYLYYKHTKEHKANLQRIQNGAYDVFLRVLGRRHPADKREG